MTYSSVREDGAQRIMAALRANPAVASNITYFAISNAGLSSIDLSMLTNLEDLYLVSNRLSSIDLSMLTKLGVVQLSNNQFTVIDSFLSCRLLRAVA